MRYNFKKTLHWRPGYKSVAEHLSSMYVALALRSSARGRRKIRQLEDIFINYPRRAASRLLQVLGAFIRAKLGEAVTSGSPGPKGKKLGYSPFLWSSYENPGYFRQFLNFREICQVRTEEAVSARGQVSSHRAFAQL